MQTNQTARTTRTRVAKAFRAMARAIEGKSAYGSTVQFYRSGGQEWAKQLG